MFFQGWIWIGIFIFGRIRQSLHWITISTSEPAKPWSKEQYLCYLSYNVSDILWLMRIAFPTSSRIIKSSKCAHLLVRIRSFSFQCSILPIIGIIRVWECETNTIKRLLFWSSTFLIDLCLSYYQVSILLGYPSLKTYIGLSTLL